MKTHFECLNKFILFVGVFCLHSCIEYKKQYVSNDYYQIRNDGDSMIIINSTKSIWTDKEEQDTMILYIDGGQFKMKDGSLFFSNKTDTSYLRKPVYCLQEEKQVVHINRKEGLNYTTIQTYFEDFGKQGNNSARLKKEWVSNYTWRLFMSTTFIYDDNYRIVNILQNGVWFFPVHLSASSDIYILKNKDIIACHKEGNEMMIVFYLHQKGGIIKKDSLRLHLVGGEYLGEKNDLFLSSVRDTVYISHKTDNRDTPFQMVINHSHNQEQNKYSICWDIMYGDDVSITVPKDIIEECNVSEIIHINESRSFLYDCDYNIVGIDYGSLSFFPKNPLE